MKLTYNLFASLILKDTAKVKMTVLELLEENSLLLKMRFRYKKGGPGCFTRSVVIQPRRVDIPFFVERTSPILRPTDFLLVAHSAKFKMKYLSSKFHYLLISFRY